MEVKVKNNSRELYQGVVNANRILEKTASKYGCDCRTYDVALRSLVQAVLKAYYPDGVQ